MPTTTEHGSRANHADHGTDQESFGYFRDEGTEEHKQVTPKRSSLSRFGSMIEKWWTESLWPGMGLFGESYLLFSIGTLTPLWKKLYPTCFDASIEPQEDEGNGLFFEDPYCSPRLLESLTYGVVLGVIAGMVLLGYGANHIGRRKGSILTAALMAGGSLGLVAVAVLAVTGLPPHRVLAGTVACLAVFGIGVGGEYPLSASLASEKEAEARRTAAAKPREPPEERLQQQHHFEQNPNRPQENHRGRRVQLVFAMQGMGIWFNSLTMLVLLWSLTGQPPKNNNNNNDDDDGNMDNDDDDYMDNDDCYGSECHVYNPNSLLMVWMITYGIGAMVLCFVLLTRIWYLEESKVWLDSKTNANGDSTAPIETNPSSSDTHPTSGGTGHGFEPERAKLQFRLVHEQYGSRMFGAGMAWLLWDVSFYGNKLFQSTFLLALVGDDAGLTELTGAAFLNATVALLGYYGAAVLVDLPKTKASDNATGSFGYCCWWKGGRRDLQSIGLLCTGGLFVACGWLASSSSSNSSIMVGLYLVSSFVGQLGPNCTTFLIPAEIIPTDQRTYCHGVCAAAGKIGALLASIVFHFVGGSDSDNDDSGDASLFYLCGIAGVLGAAVTHVFVPETAGLDLLELDLQWKFIAGKNGGAGRDSYHGPAVHEEHLSLYERYRNRKTKEGNALSIAVLS